MLIVSLVVLELRSKYISVCEDDSSLNQQNAAAHASYIYIYIYVYIYILTLSFVFIAFMQMGNSPLHHAASRGHVDLVEFLLTKGANINMQNNVGVGLCAQRAHTTFICSLSHKLCRCTGDGLGRSGRAFEVVKTNTYSARTYASLTLHPICARLPCRD